MMRDLRGKLFCFSPPVMLATFLLEFGFAIYVLWRYKMTTITRLITLLLVCLGIFQLAEYMLCGGLGLNTGEWSRLGYIAITLLPALGLHLVMAIANKVSHPLIIAVYGCAALAAAFFAVAPNAIDIHECRPNYAVFSMDEPGVLLYSFQYFVWLMIGIGMAWRWAKEQPKRAKALYGMIFGYLVFIVPSAIVTWFIPMSVEGLPSVMCGFAILLACTLVWYVLPLVSKKK